MKKIQGDIDKADGGDDGSDDDRDALIAASGIFAAFILFGVIFYGWYEGCSCSYGASLASVSSCSTNSTSCVSISTACDSTSYTTCAATGGQVKTWADCVYMSVITLTTVGFGDFSPKTKFGRVISLFWMLFGVLASGNFVTALGSFIDSKFKKPSPKGLSREAFKKIDLDNNRALSRGEFLAWMLVRKGLVQADDVKAIILKFNTISGGALEVSYEDLMIKFGEDDDDNDSTELMESN